MQEKTEKDDKKMSKQDARNEIMAHRQEIYGMGANDSEFSQIDSVLKNLDEGKITPEEAVGAVIRIN